MSGTKWPGMAFLSRWHLKGIIMSQAYGHFGKEEKEGKCCLIVARENMEYVVERYQLPVIVGSCKPC